MSTGNTRVHALIGMYSRKDYMSSKKGKVRIEIEGDVEVKICKKKEDKTIKESKGKGGGKWLNENR